MKTQKKASVKIHPVTIGSTVSLPYMQGGVRAGFPSPAEDFMEQSIDLNKELIRHPSSTFYCRAIGDSLEDIGIQHNDLMIVDKSLEPQDGKVAICFIDGEFTAKIIKVEKDCCWLMPANSKYKPLQITSDNDFIVWGIVTYVIKEL